MDIANEVLSKVAGIMTANTTAVSKLGARAMVLRAFLDAALPLLTPLQRAALARSFRQGVEDIMACMDDVALPADYHSSLLDLTNAILAALSPQSAMGA